MRLCHLPLSVLAVGFACGAAFADQAKCEADARFAMTEVFHPVGMIQQVQSIVGGKTTRSIVHSTPDKRGLTMDASGTPTHLWEDGKFYTTGDGGSSWKLLSEQTPKQQKDYLDGLESQAAKASKIECEYGVDLEGKIVDYFKIDYVLYNSDLKMVGEYWRDAENGFPWRIKSVSPYNTIVQDNEPAPELIIPAREG